METPLQKLERELDEILAIARPTLPPLFRETMTFGSGADHKWYAGKIIAFADPMCALFVSLTGDEKFLRISVPMVHATTREGREAVGEAFITLRAAHALWTKNHE